METMNSCMPGWIWWNRPRFHRHASAAAPSPCSSARSPSTWASLAGRPGRRSAAARRRRRHAATTPAAASAVPPAAAVIGSDGVALNAVDAVAAAFDASEVLQHLEVARFGGRVGFQIKGVLMRRSAFHENENGGTMVLFVFL